MAQNSQFDAVAFDELNFPYDRIAGELTPKPRLVAGDNAYVTSGGKIAKRPGTVAINTQMATLTGRIDRFKIVETIDTPPKVYLLASVYNSNTARWEMWYTYLSSVVPTWVQFTPLADVNLSTRPHTIEVARGKAYILAYPDSSSSEKYGAVVFSATASGISITRWGAVQPTAPATIDATLWFLTTDISNTVASFVVRGPAPPVAPFVIAIERELLNVTSWAAAGADWTFTTTRGYLAPSGVTTAASHVKNSQVLYRNWAASTNAIAVNLGWRYTYAYETASGHLTSPAPDQDTDLSQKLNNTGPFQNLLPKINVTGASTGEYPFIHIFRTLDAGGKYFFLEKITNTGVGTISYLDDSVVTSLGNNPLPDAKMSTGLPAPSQTSNQPPPRVNAPLVTGVAAPDETSNIAYFQGRLWYAIGNILFFSGLEEIVNGVPEESFPSGYTGNFMRYQYPVQRVICSADALYVSSLQETQRLTGSNLETFSSTVMLPDIGAPYGHKRAFARVGRAFAWLTHDMRIGWVEDGNYKVISDPLYTDIIDAVNDGAEIEFIYWGDLDKDWLLVNAIRTDDTSLCKQWVYDVRKSKQMNEDFWFLPWTIPATCMASGRLFDGQNQRRLLFAMYDTATNVTRLARLDPTGVTATDYTATGKVPYGCTVTTNLFMNPNGNHVNTLRKPTLNTNFSYFECDRTAFAGDSDPAFYFYADDFWTSPQTVAQGTAEPPPSRQPSIAYNTLRWYPNIACQRAAVTIAKPANAERFELHTLVYAFLPESGR